MNVAFASCRSPWHCQISGKDSGSKYAPDFPQVCPGFPRDAPRISQFIKKTTENYLALQRTFFAWGRSTGAQVVEIDSELFQICCGCFGMATPGCGDACLMVWDDLPCVLQAVAACRVRQGERVDQRVRSSVDLVQRDLRIFPPAAGSPAATETSDSLE